MTLKQKLDAEELALLEIVTDPIWLNEFLRSTADGEIDRNVYPTEAWKFRDYQRQFLSDKTEFILYTGGRAIGKCSPSGSKVYTSCGYKTIGQLSKEKYFIAYALDENTKEVVQRRAVAIRDKLSSAYTIKTESGFKFMATEVHPILTPDGWRLMADLQEGDYVAVATKLPWESANQALQWHELRILGYILLMPRFRAEYKIKPRFKKIGAEIEIIADRLIAHWHKDMHGNYSIKQRKGPFKHPLTSLLQQTNLFHAMRQYGAKRIPDMVMQERLDNIAIFIEALFAQFGELSQDNIALNTPSEMFSEDLQELLLRFGIESRIIQQSELSWRVQLLDYRAVYRFWNTFTLPGISVGKLPLPPASLDATDSMRFERITTKYKSHELTDTYAVHVYEHNNYIGDNLYVHNSVVLEDKMIYDIVNSYQEFPVTPEMVLVTSNQAQMTPLQNRIILRFSSSKFLKDFLRGNINKSTGVMTFPRKGKPFILTMRIAGSRGENNMVGLHIPKIIGDEMQLFPIPAWTQLQPTYNSLT